MVDNFITDDDVKETINGLERAIGYLDTDDNYLRAILQNQKLLAQAILGDMGGAGVDDTNLPEGLAGVSVDEITNNERGLAIFERSGDKIIASVKADRDIAKNDVVYISGPDNLATPTNKAQPGDVLGSGGAGSSRSAVTFEVADTEENVTLDPGETDEIVTASFTDTAFIVGVGINDETYSEYNYVANGTPILKEDLKAPLGLYNDPYTFPEPLRANGSFSITVQRGSDANGSQEYYGKILYYE